jgi:pyruvate dehydrogenase E1 component beta subunit
LRGEVPEDEEYTVPIGVSDVKREGSDVTIVAYAQGLQVSLEAAKQLAKDGIEAEVVDLRTLRPLDMEPVLESFKKTFKAVVVEEGYRSYGVGAEIAARIQEEGFDYLDAPIKRVAQKETPLPYSRELEQMALINQERVIEAVKEIV